MAEAHRHKGPHTWPVGPQGKARTRRRASGEGAVAVIGEYIEFRNRKRTEVNILPSPF